MKDPMESFRRSCRPIVGASHTIVSDENFAALLAGHHARWGMSHSADLGVSLERARQLGEWPPFRTQGFIERQANQYARSIKPVVPVMEQIAQLAEEIHSHTDDHDVRQWAWDILALSVPSSCPDCRLPIDGYACHEGCDARPHQGSRRVGPPRTGDADASRN